MRRSIKCFWSVIIVCGMVFFTACEPDSLPEDLPKSDDSAIVKKLTREELRQRFPVMEKLEEIQSDFKKTNADNDDFRVETDEVFYVEEGSRHWYTFLITTDTEESELENLVLENTNGSYTVYRITYKIESGEAHPLVIGVLEDFDFSVIGRKKPKPCYKLIRKPVAWNEQGQVTHSEWIAVIDQDCLDQLNSGGQTSSSTTSGGVRPGGWGGWMGTGLDTGVYGPPTAADNSGYTGGSSGGHPSVGTPVFTRPVFPKMKFANYIKSFKESLKAVVPNSFWWRSTSAKKIVQYLEEHFDNQTGLIDIKASEFAVWAVQYLTSHPEVTWEQFENWFLTPIEGKDGEYDSEFWENSNLTFQKQELPSYQDFFEAYPKNKNGNVIYNMLNNEVYQLVGGSLLSNYLSGNPNYKNACAIRGSRALNYSGIEIGVVIHNGLQKTEKGADHKNYILSATAFNVWMNKTFGAPTHKLLASQISNNDDVVAFLKGKTGIYTIVNKKPNEAGYSGHVDIIIEGKCLGGANANPEGGIKKIEIWELH